MHSDQLTEIARSLLLPAHMILNYFLLGPELNPKNPIIQIIKIKKYFDYFDLFE